MERDDIKIGDRFISNVDTEIGRKKGDVIEVIKIDGGTVRYKYQFDKTSGTSKGSLIRECTFITNNDYEIY